MGLKISKRIKRLKLIYANSLSRLTSIIDLERIEDAKVKYQNIQNYIISDPRILFINQIVNILLSYNKYIYAIKKLPPSSFRLTRLRDWLTPISPQVLLEQMPWPCTVNCVFCGQKGNPLFLRCKGNISKSEIDTRLKYFNGEKGLTGYCPLENDEILNNPYIEMIIQNIRRKSKDELIINTSGAALDQKMIKILKRARPVTLIVSLNSANAYVRKKTMSDFHPEIAIKSIPLLKKYRIPYILSIVPWPGIGLKDIEKTIGYADRNDAYLVRIYLPGYSGWFSKKKLFDRDRYWQGIIARVRKIKNKFSTPVIFTPQEYIQIMEKTMDLPVVIGTIKNSPSYLTGMRGGDLIKEVNGVPIRTIEGAYNELIGSGGRGAHILIERRGERQRLFRIKANPQRPKYPYSAKEFGSKIPFGILLFPGITGEYTPKQSDIDDIRKYIMIHEAKKVMVITSKMYYPLLKHRMKNLGIFDIKGVKIEIVAAKNVFYGGIIDSASLLTVDDIIKTVKRFLAKDRPDLIIIPGSFFSLWGRDLMGKLNLYIERETGVPVEFIYTSNA